MRDLNEHSNSCSWPLYYGDRGFTNGHFYNGFLPRATADVYPGYDKDTVKQTILEHEAIFKNQLCELHRLYRIQRDLMDEVKRKELYKNRMLVETSLSSSPLASQITSEDARKWQIPNFPLANSVCAGPSTSGIDEMHSPLSSMKGSSLQASLFPSQNGGTSKDAEILEPRPTKVRRKMFDLQLPADEYIDTEEGAQLRHENVCGTSSYLPNRNHKVSTESGINLLIGTGGKNNIQEDALRSKSCLKSKNNLADLNEPIEIVDKNATANDIVGHTSSHYGIQGHELDAKPTSQFHDLPKEILLNSHLQSNNGTVNNLHPQNNVNAKLWFPHMLDSGNNKNNLNPASQYLQPEKLHSSSQAMHVLSNKINEPATLVFADQSKVDLLRERAVCGSEISGRNNEASTNNHPVSVVASLIPSQYGTDPSSDLGNSWSRSISSWEKIKGNLNQKSMSVQIHPYLNSSATLSRSSQSSAQSHVVFGDRWNYTSNLASNLSIGSDMPEKNGFYHGSSSGSKELHIRFPSGNSDYLNCSSANNVAPENFINHGSVKFYKTSNCMDSKSVKDVNLNVAFSNSSSTKMVSQQGVEVIDLERNDEDHLVTLPWLRTKPEHKNEVTGAGVDLNAELQSSPNQLSDKSEAGNFPTQTVVANMKSASCSNFVKASRIAMSGSSSCRKILGFPIFEKSHISKIESSSLTSPSVSLSQPSEEVENNRKSRVLDINLPCDPAVPDCGQQIAAEVVLIEKESDTQVASFRCEIDLNSCATEDEHPFMPSDLGSDAKIISGIDLEAPAVPETEEDVIPTEECLEKAHEAPPLPLLTQHNVESPPDEFVFTAAEAIVAISLTSHRNYQDDVTGNPSEASMTDPLHWFAEVISSFGEDLESKSAVLGAENVQDNEGSSSEDYFESMTLRLAETREEDYMPKPLVPENLKLEENGRSLLPTRTRRGQARRGRQRRDFQRDILPGLASLSRHEVTEDLQTFGGLMRATGHLWHLGLTRRNSARRGGCARGRRRALVTSSPPLIASPPCTPLIQQLSNVEVGLDDGSLTGWGKTTRRPRRQRCPPGNPPVIPLT